MNFTEAVRSVFREKYATFSGRAARAEYWWSMLAWTMVLLVLAMLLLLVVWVSGDTRGDLPVLAWPLIAALVVVTLGSIVPMIAVTVRRLHDRNMSGWWYLGAFVAGLIPAVGWLASVALMVICALKGTSGPNKYGADPLNRYSVEVFR